MRESSPVTSKSAIFRAVEQNCATERSGTILSLFRPSAPRQSSTESIFRMRSVGRPPSSSPETAG